ncbi:cortistatin [Phyllopteryx taeniolatus]|uniref:cortistatin n=2 Tax=Syngnathinae TaxID=129914 RepID=UPI002AD359DD|nr:cortistatin [Phyllopteryx taeniolatus]
MAQTSAKQTRDSTCGQGTARDPGQKCTNQRRTRGEAHGVTRHATSLPLIALSLPTTPTLLDGSLQSPSMQILVVVAAFMGVLLSVRAAAVLPVEDSRSPMQGLNRGQDLSKQRKELILKLVSSLLEGALDTNILPEETSPEELEEPLDSRLVERAVYNRLSLPQRDRKAPCKNFFWKTFTSC